MIGKLTLGIIAFLAVTSSSQQTSTKVVCYYDSKGNFRDGHARFEITFLEESLNLCTHLIYGFAGIDADTHKLNSLNEQFDITRDNYRQITNLKRRYPKVQFLLSVGGGRDNKNPDKYLTLLESVDSRLDFIDSARTFLKSYGFDGLDLAWQFPPNKPKKIRSTLGNAWSNLKHTFVAHSEIDPKAEDHRAQFTAFVREIKDSFSNEGLMLSMSVLPNVNSTIFHDVRGLLSNFDFINLWAFDYYTPARNPKEADFPAPLYELIDRNHNENGNALVTYWLQNGAASNTSRLVLGIPTFARTWKIISNSVALALPPIADVKGPGEQGPYTKEEGILSYQEVCKKVYDTDYDYTHSKNSYRVISSNTSEKSGAPTYAFRFPNDGGDGGIWIGYDDLETAKNKAIYANNKRLGGLAIVDITLDDFRGLCTGTKYPILRAAKFRI